MSTFRKMLGVSVVTLFLFGMVAGEVRAQSVAYLQHHNPWSSTINQSQLNAVFGLGGWTQYSYADDPAVIFGDNCFVMMEGGEANDGYLARFLTANQAAVTSWIMGGGSLYVHAAGWFVTPDLTFLGATYVHNNYVNGGSGTATNPLHSIFAGPYAPTGLAWTGNFLAHAYFTGIPDYSTLIQDAAQRPILIERPLGAGHVILSALTTTNWHSPFLEADNLAKNILVYGASKANCNVIPEPGAIAMLAGAALALLPFLRRSRSR